MEKLITKYEKEINELYKWQKKLKNEYCKTQRQETKESFMRALVKIKTLEQVVRDLKEYEEDFYEIYDRQNQEIVY